MNKSNIVLCGFMASGKTGIGLSVAKKLGMEFCDIDKYIEKKESMSVSEIFEKCGESAFREAESLAVLELSKLEGKVIACGGGTVLNKNNIEAFYSFNNKIYFLDVPLAALQERLKSDKSRPLIQKPNRREIIEQLYNERISRYREAADIIIDAGAPVNVVVKRIIKEAETAE